MERGTNNPSLRKEFDMARMVWGNWGSDSGYKGRVNHRLKSGNIIKGESLCGLTIFSDSNGTLETEDSFVTCKKCLKMMEKNEK